MTGEIKICGLNSPETLEAALEAGADFIGMVFFAKSPRHVDLTTAAALAGLARGRAGIVALTVDPTDEALAAILDAVHPDLIQLHGDESVERVAAIRARFTVPVMKALGIATHADLDAVRAHATVADRLLLDAKALPGSPLPGGNGLPFDWNLIADLDADLDLPKPFMLSGGLTPENVGEAIRLTHAPGVDVSSGVESAPGVKDPARIVAFVQAARAAFADMSRQPITAAAPAKEKSPLP